MTRLFTFETLSIDTCICTSYQLWKSCNFFVIWFYIFKIWM